MISVYTINNHPPQAALTYFSANRGGQAVVSLGARDIDQHNFIVTFTNVPTSSQGIFYSDAAMKVLIFIISYFFVLFVYFIL